MQSRASKHKGVSPDVWEVFAPAPAGRGRVGAELIGGRAANRRLSLGGVSVLYIEDSVLENVTLADVSGSFFLGSGSKPTRYLRCSLEITNRHDYLIFGYSEFIECEFLGLRAPQIGAYDASFTGCRFVGQASIATFSIDPESRVQKESLLPLLFQGNDLTGFVCPDLDFRGGISLEQNRLRESEDELVLLDVLRTASRLEVRGHLAKYSEAQLERLQRLKDWCARTKQRDLFIPFALTRRFSPEELQLVRDLKVAQSLLS